MKIALVDSRIEYHEGFAGSYERLALYLRRRTHNVDISSRLKKLPLSLSNYDLAIAHTYPEERETLVRELKDRPDFRWILISASSENHVGEDIRESGQFYSMGTLISRNSREKLARLIEEGW